MGGELEIEVSPGKQELHLQIDWGRSRKLFFDLAEGEEARFQCAPRSAFAALYWSTLGRSRYVRLEQVEPPEG